MKRSDRIKAEISIFTLLSDYGYDVVDSPREQQFSCNLHGDGQDNSPSARAYPESNSWYCFACGKVRDSISTVMEIEGVEFKDACSKLERKYNLPEWVYKPRAEIDVFKDLDIDTDEMEDISSRVERSLMQKTKDTPLGKSLALWEAYNFLDLNPNTTPEQWLRLLGKVWDS